MKISRYIASYWNIVCIVKKQYCSWLIMTVMSHKCWIESFWMKGYAYKFFSTLGMTKMELVNYKKMTSCVLCMFCSKSSGPISLLKIWLMKYKTLNVRDACLKKYTIGVQPTWTWVGTTRGRRKTVPTHPSQRLTTQNRWKSKCPLFTVSTFHLRSVKPSAVASSSEKCARRSLVELSDRQACIKLSLWEKKFSWKRPE